MKQLRLFWCYTTGVLSLRRSDVILSSYPRSGSTWIRFILCNLISLSEWNGRRIDFSILNDTMMELGNNNLLQSWPYSTTIPRVVKTHLKYIPLFYRNRSIGVIRDPRDTMVSYYHYKKDRQCEFRGTFHEFLRHPDFGLSSWFEHYQSWRERWTLVIQYENIRENTHREVRNILHLLEADNLPESIVHEAIRRSDIRNIRSIDDLPERAKPNIQAQFARSGRTEQWPFYFSDEDLRYYSELLEKYNVRVYSTLES